MCNQKFKYIKGALVIAETKCEGREKEIIKSAAQMIDKIAGEIENSEKQIIALKYKTFAFYDVISAVKRENAELKVKFERVMHENRNLEAKIELATAALRLAKNELEKGG